MQIGALDVRITIILATALVVLGACAPGADGALGPPTFRLQSEGSGFVRLDVATVTAPSATFRLVLDVANPNPVPVRLALLEGDLVVASVPSARVRFVDGIDLPARGQARLTLDVTIAADALPALGDAFADALLGRPVAYRLDAEVGVDVIGVLRRFPRTTVVAGEVRSALTLAAPTVRYDAAASGVRSVAFDRVVFDLVFDLDNTGAVGMIVRAPDVRVAIGGRNVATVQVLATPLPAGGSARVVQELVINPTQLGAAIVAELTRLAAGQAGSVRIALSGAWDLEVPGVVSRRIDAAQFLDVPIE
jgi:hypothetical protein